MTAIIDAGPLISASDRADPRANEIRRLLAQPREPIVTVAPVVSEVDHLLTVRFGDQAAVAFLVDLGAGLLPVHCLEPAEYMMVSQLSTQYADLRPGLADLAIVVLAARLGTRRIVTWDQRHFRAMKPLQGGVFTLLPWDET